MGPVFAIVLSLLAIFLILLVLVQRGRGGGLAGALGGMAVVTGCCSTVAAAEVFAGSLAVGFESLVDAESIVRRLL